MTSADLLIERESLRCKYQQEMVAQNNAGSVARCYAEADKIQERIREVERQLINMGISL